MLAHLKDLDQINLGNIWSLNSGFRITQTFKSYYVRTHACHFCIDHVSRNSELFCMQLLPNKFNVSFCDL
jgi:hypothetical protein